MFLQSVGYEIFIFKSLKVILGCFWWVVFKKYIVEWSVVLWVGNLLCFLNEFVILLVPLIKCSINAASGSNYIEIFN
jgi:hypothetical protein